MSKLSAALAAHRKFIDADRLSAPVTIELTVGDKTMKATNKGKSWKELQDRATKYYDEMPLLDACTTLKQWLDAKPGPDQKKQTEKVKDGKPKAMRAESAAPAAEATLVAKTASASVMPPTFDMQGLANMLGPMLASSMRASVPMLAIENGAASTTEIRDLAVQGYLQANRQAVHEAAILKYMTDEFYEENGQVKKRFLRMAARILIKDQPEQVLQHAAEMYIDEEHGDEEEFQDKSVEQFIADNEGSDDFMGKVAEQWEPQNSTEEIEEAWVNANRNDIEERAKEEAVERLMTNDVLRKQAVDSLVEEDFIKEQAIDRLMEDEDIKEQAIDRIKKERKTRRRTE